MSVLFCYDGPIEKDSDGNYYSTALNDEMFERYKVLSDKINILIRVNKIDKIEISNRYLPLSKEKYCVIECSNLSTLKGILFKRKQVEKLLEKNIKQSEFIIIRLPSLIGNLAIKIANKLNKKYLIEVVGCPWDSLWNYNLKGKIIAPFITYLMKKQVKQSKYTLYVTEKFLQHRYPTLGKQISCSNVILDNYQNDILENRIKNIEPRKNNNFTLATLAAIDVKYKGQKDVIKAVSKLKKYGINVKYKIIGSGNPKYLKKIVDKYNVNKEVEFLGSISHNKVFSILDNIDIYVQPSKQEGLPRAVIEAMSRGCLCIGTNAGGIPELLDQKYIYKKGNASEIVNIIKNIDKQDFINQAKRNFRESQKYDREKLTKRREKFFIDYKKGVNKND